MVPLTLNLQSPLRLAQSSFVFNHIAHNLTVGISAPLFDRSADKGGTACGFSDMVFDWSADQVERWVGDTMELKCCREAFRANKAGWRRMHVGGGGGLDPYIPVVIDLISLLGYCPLNLMIIRACTNPLA